MHYVQPFEVENIAKSDDRTWPRLNFLSLKNYNVKILTLLYCV